MKSAFKNRIYMPFARKPWLTVYRAPSGFVCAQNRKCSGSRRQIGKPRRPDRVKASRFDFPVSPCLGKSIGKQLNGTKVGHDDPKFGILDGFHQISVLAPVIGLPFAGIIINTQVMLLNAWVTPLDVHFRQILTYLTRKFGFLTGFMKHRF